jgi:choline transport protein
MNVSVGWFSCIAWQAGTAGGMFLAGTTMQGLVVATHPDYVPQPYQGFLFVVMVATFALAANTLLARYLPRLEGPVFVLFFLAFIAVLAVLWTIAPQLTAAEVFGTITKGPGWDSLGLSLLVSQGAIMFLIVGQSGESLTLISQRVDKLSS